MHSQAIKLINLSLKGKKVMGLDLMCQYRSCHEGLEDCTFCFCPFYPCNDPSTGGYEMVSKKTGKPVWACSKCLFPHKANNAAKILAELVKCNKNIEDIPHQELLRIRQRILQEEGQT